MKVKELITRLQACDPESIVVIAGYEGGVDELIDVNAVHIRLNANTAWYYGRHALDENSNTEAVYLT